MKKTNLTLCIASAGRKGRMQYSGKQMRSTRNQPFCWQEKKITRLLREKYVKNLRSKMILLYATITEIDSDFNNVDIKYYTKTIGTYSGLSKEFIPTGLKELKELGVLKIVSEKVKGKFKGKRIVFTPEKVHDTKENTAGKTVNEKTFNGESVNGNLKPSEDSKVSEDSNEKKMSIYHSVASHAENDGAVSSEHSEGENTVTALNGKINEILIIFKTFNDVGDSELFKNETQQGAVERLLKKVGENDLREKLKFLADMERLRSLANRDEFYQVLYSEIMSLNYVPEIRTPKQLEEKYCSLTNRMECVVNEMENKGYFSFEEMIRSYEEKESKTNEEIYESNE